jgi:hypothetical protein
MVYSVLLYLVSVSVHVPLTLMDSASRVVYLHAYTNGPEKGRWYQVSRHIETASSPVRCRFLLKKHGMKNRAIHRELQHCFCWNDPKWQPTTPSHKLNSLNHTSSSCLRLRERMFSDLQAESRKAIQY